MFHTDYLLKMFTTDVEVSALPPFPIRPLSDGLMRRLPLDFRRKLTAFHCEPRSSEHGEAHRFWIEAGELEYTQTNSGSELQYIFGNLSMVVKTHKLVIDQATGRHTDSDETQDAESWESRMAKFLTNSFDEIARYFPEFARLRELAKLQAVYRLVKR